MTQRNKGNLNFSVPKYKVSLKHSHDDLLTYGLWWLSWDNSNRDLCGLESLKYLLSNSLQKIC